MKRAERAWRIASSVSQARDPLPLGPVLVTPIDAMSRNHPALPEAFGINISAVAVVFRWMYEVEVGESDIGRRVGNSRVGVHVRHELHCGEWSPAARATGPNLLAVKLCLTSGEHL
eukprot:3369420-Rhodomonas_salina.1